jgi:hypothetical protein
MRNILANLPHKEKRRIAAQLVQEYGDGERFLDTLRWLEVALEDSLQFYSFLLRCNTEWSLITSIPMSRSSAY